MLNRFKSLEDQAKTQYGWDLHKEFDNILKKRDSDGKTFAEMELERSQKILDVHKNIYKQIENMPVMDMTYEDAVAEIDRIRKKERATLGWK